MAQTTPVATTKVFVGNLAFKTKENELADAFGASVKVLGAKIITRRGRSLGYGFIEVGNEQDAQKAVQAMDKKDVDGRQINVEVARPREEGQGEQQQQQQPQENKGGFTRGGRGGRGRRGGFRGSSNFRGGFRRRFNDEGEQGEQGEQQDRPRGRGGFRGARRGTRGAARGGARGGKTGGAPTGPDTRTESKTSLFVANLPFSLDDAAFGKIFTDAGLKFKAAHVVTKRNGRSKGFGFVEFETNEDQQKALQTLNGKQVEGREITLKVALTDNRENANDNAQTDNIKKEEGKN